MLMNSADRAAVLRYEPSSFRMVSPGNHVVCAVSGEKIPLEALRYWSVDLQEAYATPEIATKRILGL
ncbi:MAG: DUF2093 domain-containing protein [Sphingomonadales bacterium]|nr:DUF2093 domain-containing protein [Sphingomonadales bacterium]MDE2172182.1 DUF2093 domain-containing protein [Sphingomonadales bacterium]